MTAVAKDDDWNARANARRDFRATKVPETPGPGKGSRKDTKRWCKGKVGREHVGVCMNRYEKYLIEWRELVCKNCGRRLDTYYGGLFIGQGGPKPDWYVE